MPKFIDLTGKIFGRWRVISRADDTHYKHPQWLCICDCGNKKIVKSQTLRDGQSKSCGCLNRDVQRQKCIDRNTSHGLSKTRTYRIWSGMIQRCFNKNNHKYNIYGARNITVCKSWLKFANFYRDMGECPPHHTLDRINTNGIYKPSNCRWATQKTQQNNRLNNRKITFNGVTLCVTEWARQLGTSHKTITGRLDRGWSIRDALSKKPIKGRNQYNNI